MQRIRSLALPAAICVAIVGACNDVPLAPRPPATDGLAPNAILTSDGSTMPQILSHNEKLSFGWHTASSSVPSAVNAEMTFIGDDGEIDLANVTVTPDSAGAPFTNSAQMALGPGQIVNCADVTLGSCNNHHLSGVASLSGAPDCNARASGTIAYWAAVVRSSLGFSWGPISTYTGSGLTTVSSSAPFTATAPRCATTQQQGTTGGTSGDSSSTSGTGTVGPPPPPTGPNVPVAPPPYSPPPSGGGFVCQQTDVYQIIGTTRTLFSSVIDCYPDQ